MQRDVTASVFLGDRYVGVLGYHDGNTWFDYGDLSVDHPVLGQGFERDPRKRRSGSGSVPEWFANLLPEPGSGLRGMIATELSKKKLHDFVLLNHLGNDLPGAVRVVPDVPLDGLPDHEPTSVCEHEHSLRFSLAGVQPKFSMRYEERPSFFLQRAAEATGSSSFPTSGSRRSPTTSSPCSSGPDGRGSTCPNLIWYPGPTY